MKRLILLAVIAAALAGCQKKDDAAAPGAAPAADSASVPKAQQTTDPSADVPAGALPPAENAGTPPKKP